MDRMIFVNLPVSDLAASRAFYTGLGFSADERFSDDRTAGIAVSDTVYIMLLTADRFRDFINGEISDAHTTTEVLNALSAESPRDVDDLVARALAHGGKPWKDKMVEDSMYGHSFTDPDGHVWEVVAMDTSQEQ